MAVRILTCLFSLTSIKNYAKIQLFWVTLGLTNIIHSNSYTNLKNLHNSFIFKGTCQKCMSNVKRITSKAFLLMWKENFVVHSSFSRNFTHTNESESPRCMTLQGNQSIRRITAIKEVIIMKKFMQTSAHSCDERNWIINLQFPLNFGKQLLYCQ